MASRVFWKIYRHLQQEANASAHFRHVQQQVRLLRCRHPVLHEEM